MAKAKPIDDIECDAPAAAAASEVLRVRLNEIFEFHDAAVEPDGIDGVHDMRVASRRFRSALRDFARLFDKKAVKHLNKQIKAIADALGDVRDQDVAIEALTSMREKARVAVIAADIDLLVESRRSQRSNAHNELLDQISADRLARLHEEFAELLDLRDLEKHDTTFRSFAVDTIEAAHKKFLARAESIYDPLDDKALHKLRLSAKRLRYALELFYVCWDGELNPFAKYVSKLQSSLGEVHDSSEWIKSLSMSTRENNSIDRHTAAWLISEFVSLRTAEYLKALELWNERLTTDLNGRLQATMTK